MISVTYIHHDCFVIRSNEWAMVFDYWVDPMSEIDSEPRFLNHLDAEKPLYVFVSHSHKDHFNKNIFNWASRFRHIHYLVSHETAKRCRYMISPTSVYKGTKIDADKLTGFKVGDEWEDGRISVRAYGSTDIGVSWLIEVGGRRIYHAGDFNFWGWKDESTPGEVKDAYNRFKKILDLIREDMNGNSLDFVFFPVDSRIGSGYFEGAKEFVRALVCHIFFPMHFGLGDENEQRIRIADAMNIELYANPDRGEYVGLTAPYSRYVTAEA